GRRSTTSLARGMVRRLIVWRPSLAARLITCCRSRPSAQASVNGSAPGRIPMSGERPASEGMPFMASMAQDCAGGGPGVSVRIHTTAVCPITGYFDASTLAAGCGLPVNEEFRNRLARRVPNLFGAVFMPMFMAAVDQTLLATATPAIAASLGGLRDTSWIAVGYLLASATIVPVYGRLGDLRGRRQLLLVALGVFALGSAACGLAQSLPQLVAARILQGLGG